MLFYALQIDAIIHQVNLKVCVDLLERISVQIILYVSIKLKV